MIHSIGGPDIAATGFVVKPNQAMSWQSLMLDFAGIAAVTLTIGVSFYLIGLTLVLPFSGIEILVLGAAFYITACNGDIQEVIVISRDTIVIERGKPGPEQREIFQRTWSQVVLERPWNSWYPGRLLIRSHGRQVEIGKFLNEQERQGLAIELGKALKNNQALN